MLFHLLSFENGRTFIIWREEATGQQKGGGRIDKIFFLCDGEREKCKKRGCYKNGGNCRHTTDISHAMNFERRGKYKSGSFYEKEDVSRNETSSMD